MSGTESSPPLIVSVSGIRGVVGASLTPEVATRFATCFGTPLAGRPVVVSRDGRATGVLFRDAVTAGLAAVGCRVLDIGIAATPTCGHYVRVSGAAGAVQITASHNPPEWNGLKLFRPEGFVLSPDAGEEVAARFRAGDARLATWDRVLPPEYVADPHGPHLQRVIGLVDLAAIRQRRFHVVLDVNHGSGAVFGPRLLERLGCRVTVLGGEPDGRFEHQPEPTAENLTGLAEQVTRHGADLGFAVDPDADRLAIVDGTGRYIGEEYTLALAILRRSQQATGPVVLNASTSLLSETVAKQAGCPTVRTAVGEVHVAERMLRESALIGGEGNGGVIDPRVGMGRDSAIGMALVLDLLAADSRPLHEIVDGLPRFAICKQKATIDRSTLPTLFERLRAAHPDVPAETYDGLRLAWDDAWLQVRASNTEPIVRIFAETPDAGRSEELAASALRTIEGAS